MRAAATLGLLAFVYAAVQAFWWIDGRQSPVLYAGAWSGVVKTTVWVLPALAAAAVLTPGPSRTRVLRAVGLDARAATGLAFGLFATLPLGIAVASSGHRQAGIDAIIGTALLGPFAEEVLFRGFLMTQLRDRVRLSLRAAMAVSAVAFGLAHAPQLHAHLGFYHISSAWEFTVVRVGVIAGQVAMLAAGGLVFGWVYFRTASLWPAIGLHACLNFWLTIAADQEFTIPGWSTSLVAIAQLLSFVIALAIVEGRATMKRVPGRA
jgi:membrane protease YdiL (CAAX protease family)